MSAIGMLDLRAEYAELRATIDQAMQRVLDSGHFILGPEGEALETEIAARVGCSLRTLYGIAPSKDELILSVVDRRLHRIGRAAIEVLDAEMPALDALRDQAKLIPLPKDVYVGLFKAFVFGIVIAVISCGQGLRTRGGAIGVGRATQRAVRDSIIAVIVCNYLLAWLFYEAF